MTTSTSPSTNADVSIQLQLSELNEIPWRTAFRLGSGVDALTAAATSTALANVETVNTSASEESISVERCSDMGAALRAVSSGRAKSLPWLEPLGLRASTMAKALAARDPFKTSIALVVWLSRTETRVAFPPAALSMTTEAQVLQKTNPKRFRETYGDYFVSGALHGRQLAAVITIRYESTDALEAQTEIVQLLPSAQPQQLSAVKASLDKLLASSTVTDVSTRVFGRSSTTEPELLETFSVPGARKSSSAFSACIERLRNISSSSDRPILAQLTHYSTLLPSKSESSARAVPLDRNAYDELQKLCSLFERCLFRAASLPDRLVQDKAIMELRDEVRYLASDCLASRGVIVTPGDSRREWLRAFAAVDESLNEFYGVYDVWAMYAATPYRKPSPALEGPWEHGVSNSEGTPYLEVKNMSWRPVPSFPVPSLAHPFANRHTEGIAPLGAYIVGWTVKVLVQGTVTWVTVQGSRLLRPRVRFQLPWRSRSTWEFTIYYASHAYLDILARAYRDELVVRYDTPGNEPVQTPQDAIVYPSWREIE